MRFVKTLVAVASGVVLAACGGEGTTTITVSSGKGGGADLLQAMQDAQLEAGSFKLDMSITANVSGEEREVMDASGPSEMVDDDTVNQQVEITTRGEKGDETVWHLVMLDGVAYTDMFAAMGKWTDTEWVFIDPKSDDPMSKMFGRLTDEQAGMADTMKKLAENADAVSVEEGTNDTIDGVDVTEYLVTVEMAYFEELGLTGFGAESLPIDELTYSLWLDDDYLPRRMTMDLGEEAGGVAMELNLSDFGSDVTIEPPPKGDVVPVGELIDDLLKSGKITGKDLAEPGGVLGSLT